MPQTVNNFNSDVSPAAKSQLVLFLQKYFATSSRFLSGIFFNKTNSGTFTNIYTVGELKLGAGYDSGTVDNYLDMTNSAGVGNNTLSAPSGSTLISGKVGAALEATGTGATNGVVTILSSNNTNGSIAVTAFSGGITVLASTAGKTISITAPNGTLTLGGGTAAQLTSTSAVTLSCSTTGTISIGVSTNLVGFYGVTPVARQLLATGAGHTVDDVITALQTIGILRQS